MIMLSTLLQTVFVHDMMSFFIDPGDGLRAGSERCDDGNIVSGDGCSAACVIECGFDCNNRYPTSPDTCNSECGDGIKSSVEECDDGNTENDDGCTQDCVIELDFACLPLQCKQTTCQAISTITSCDEVVGLLITQTETGRAKTVWSHPALPVVSVFEVECSYSIYGSSVTLTYNVTLESCPEFMCETYQENLVPGMSLTCSVRALVEPYCWSDWKIASMLVVGPPSSPLDLSISQDSTMDPCRTAWSIGWSDPLDHGDTKPPGSLERAELTAFSVHMFCGDNQAIVKVGKVKTVGLQAVWECGDVSRDCAQVSIPQAFSLRSSAYPDFSLQCLRGETVSTKVRAHNVLFDGEWSSVTSRRASGLPSPVTALQALENQDSIVVSWQQVRVLSDL
jgi:cysteine-rich repeat protein